MANNYWHFSEVIPQLTDEEADWLRAEYKKLRGNEDGGGEDVAAIYEQGNFEMTVNRDGDDEWGLHAWFRSEESGTPEHVADFAQRFLKKFRPDRFFTLSWASVCDKPRPGEFDGGSVFVTADNQRWMSSGKWIEKCQGEWERRRKKKRRKK